jgi:hypothetical protein
LLGNGILAGFIVVTIGWSVMLTYSFFRAGLQLSPGRSLIGSLLFYVLFDGSIAAWYALTGQLYPLIFGVS